MSHEDNLLAEWLKHPGSQVAADRINAEITRRVEALARVIVSSEIPLDQRKVDRERGFRQGALWFLAEAKKGAKAFERDKDGEQV